MTPAQQFHIQELRMQNIQRVLESMVLFVAALFISALLPSLIIRYAYAGQPLFEQPPILDVIPVVAFVVAVGYFVYAIFDVLMRNARLRRMEREMMVETPRTTTANVTDLQAAMTRVEKGAGSKTRGRRTTRRR